MPRLHRTRGLCAPDRPIPSFPGPSWGKDSSLNISDPTSLIFWLSLSLGPRGQRCPVRKHKRSHLSSPERSKVPTDPRAVSERFLLLQAVQGRRPAQQEAVSEDETFGPSSLGIRRVKSLRGNEVDRGLRLRPHSPGRTTQPIAVCVTPSEKRLSCVLLSIVSHGDGGPDVFQKELQRRNQIKPACASMDPSADPHLLFSSLE